MLRDLMLELGALVPWKCINVLDLGSVRILIVLLYEFLYIECLNAGNSELWSLRSESIHWTLEVQEF